MDGGDRMLDKINVKLTSTCVFKKYPPMPESYKPQLVAMYKLTLVGLS